ncbi:hypothetical protein [Nocardia wallacei]|uniref:hypothetical protein n=1 Tax=Nocardia wallacei TaxID=480035 RepID=UPI002454D7C2|nr:hypothetical protein [Nocardia wallacei]
MADQQAVAAADLAVVAAEADVDVGFVAAEPDSPSLDRRGGQTAGERERPERAGRRGEPVGNTLNHNLIRALMDSTTLVPPDLRLLDHPGE